MNKKFILERVYTVAQNFGQNSNFHIDDKYENKITFCYYVNYSTENSLGDFFIKIPNKKEILSIEPTFNRGILFPSNFTHKGTAFFDNDNIRVCITWKFSIID